MCTHAEQYVVSAFDHRCRRSWPVDGLVTVSVSTKQGRPATAFGSAIEDHMRIRILHSTGWHASAESDQMDVMLRSWSTSVQQRSAVHHDTAFSGDVCGTPHDVVCGGSVVAASSLPFAGHVHVTFGRPSVCCAVCAWRCAVLQSTTVVECCRRPPPSSDSV